ncbi:DUF6880 family protein [Ideonella sp.]|uniref:DUF6880 family protein n=1 Tax=Ideonella sp. TaxID=1929293 RepID=UPI002B45CF69|nr:DUF6880 family protein [Ideonella sp.]HJV71273.1 hypothetical protein [Ideonella sp.]
MPKAPPDSLEAILQRQPAATLAAVLVELAADHDAVRQRLARMQLADRPDKLAASFTKTLAAWKRSRRFYDYRQAREFGQELQAWLDQVARELAPKDPAAAVALFEAFIEADASWFERADDSDGAVGDAVRAACRHWLQAAALCETPAHVWPERLMKLVLADEYGAREELLRRADLLLSQPALRELVASLQARMGQTVAAAPDAATRPHEVYKLSAALSLLSEALHDPDVKVRAVLSYSPQPNAVQRQDFVQAYLDADRPADALPWLQDPWGQREDSRQRLLAEALGRLGRFEDSAPIRQRLFENTLSAFDLQRWLEHLPEAAHPEARARARALVLEHDDPKTAAVLLLELGDAESAEHRLIAEQARIDGTDYPALAPLAKSLRAHECPRGETVVYRALLRGILDRAYSRAYGHAARYWARLHEIADEGVDLMPLPAHEAFEAEIRSRHARKASFWAHVNGSRSMPTEEEDGPDA